jgi:hypothetical protein
MSSDGSKNANKATSKEPGNIRALHIIEDIEIVIRMARTRMKDYLGYAALSMSQLAIHVEAVDSSPLLDEIVADLRGVVRQARIFLGYDMPKCALPDSECDVCKGILIVAKDASSDVICIGIEGMGGCGKKYRRTDWAAMLEQRNALVDTLSAVIYTGRPVGTLYAWASEGRVGRYGKAGKGNRLWSLTELPQAIPGQPLPPPPPLPKRTLPTPLPTAPARDSTPDDDTQDIS